jgi:hypothetical protein
MQSETCVQLVEFYMYQLAYSDATSCRHVWPSLWGSWYIYNSTSSTHVWPSLWSSWYI